MSVTFIRRFCHGLFSGFTAFALALGLSSSARAHDDDGLEKLPEKLGTVNFRNSCAPSVRARLNRAVALLHSFAWHNGEQAFRDVLSADPSCAVAHWGIASILINNPFGAGPISKVEAARAIAAIEQGRAMGAKTPRERELIEAVAEYYRDFGKRPQSARLASIAAAFGALVSRYPDDDELRIFYSLYLTTTQSPTDKTFATALKAAQMLEPMFRKFPDHPGIAHYLIHSYDYPPIAAKGLPAARKYASIAASVPHALHMPSHIFTRVGAWADSAETNRRGAVVAKREAAHGDQLHAMDYMAYAYLQMGHDIEVARLLGEAPAVKFERSAARLAHYYSLAAIPARYAIERGDWAQAANLPVRSGPAETEAISVYARALGAGRRGDAAQAAEETAQLAQLRDRLLAAKSEYWAEEVAVKYQSALAWVAFAQGRRDEALRLMREAAGREDKSEKAAVSPGRLIPARELLGDMLFEAAQPAEALAEYEASLQRDPDRFRGLYGAGMAANRAGDAAKARKHLTRLLETSGKLSRRDEVAEARELLRGMSGKTVTMLSDPHTQKR